MPIMLVVLLGALLHASWNVLAKSGGDALIDTTLILLGGSVLAVLALPLLPAPAPASWPFIAASSVLQMGYFALVGAAYRSGEVESRLSADARHRTTAAGAGEQCGSGRVAQRPGGLWRYHHLYWRADDGAGALAKPGGLAHDQLRADERGGHCHVYTGGRCRRPPLKQCPGIHDGDLRCVVCPVCTLGRLAAFVRAGDGGAAALASGLAGGACIILSYALALWAMTRGPIAPVAALRETSILFGLLLARIALGERPSRARVAAGLLILAGAGALRLG